MVKVHRVLKRIWSALLNNLGGNIVAFYIGKGRKFWTHEMADVLFSKFGECLICMEVVDKLIDRHKHASSLSLDSWHKSWIVFFWGIQDYLSEFRKIVLAGIYCSFRNNRPSFARWRRMNGGNQYGVKDSKLTECEANNLVQRFCLLCENERGELWKQTRWANSQLREELCTCPHCYHRSLRFRRRSPHSGEIVVFFPKARCSIYFWLTKQPGEWRLLKMDRS